MPLTGQAKVDYQREYMRRRRSNAGSNQSVASVRPESVRPVTSNVTPETKPNLRDYKIAFPFPNLEGTVSEKTARKMEHRSAKKPVQPPGKSDSEWNYIQMKAKGG